MATPAPRVLLTGPSRGIEEWSRAARGVGWEPIELVLLETRARPVLAAELPERADWICLTSSNALPWLAEALAARPALLAARLAVVGPRSAARLGELGLAPSLPPASDAAELATLVGREAAPGARVLWPRGPVSEELGARLTAAGFAVTAPLAYDSATPAASRAAPPARATFFASPSAVRAFAALPGAERARGSALAIGSTTQAALMEETALGFLDTIALPEPTPHALALVLEHLDPTEPSAARKGAR